MEFEIKSTIGNTSLKMRFRKQENSKALVLEMNDGEDGKYTHLTCISEFDMDSDWQPVLQEVTWQEALEAWLFKDKRIKCTTLIGIYIYTLETRNIPIGHITNGKWYILEDE